MFSALTPGLTRTQDMPHHQSLALGFETGSELTVLYFPSDWKVYVHIGDTDDRKAG